MSVKKCWWTLFNPKVATHPSLGSVDVALLGVDNGSGYSSNEVLIQHLCVRLMRKYGWVWLIMWAAQAPYHSAWHWQSEQRWSLVRGQEQTATEVGDDDVG